MNRKFSRRSWVGTGSKVRIKTIKHHYTPENEPMPTEHGDNLWISYYKWGLSIVRSVFSTGVFYISSDPKFKSISNVEWIHNTRKKHEKSSLVGTNPSEKYARQIGNHPQVGVEIQKKWNHQLDHHSCLVTHSLKGPPLFLSNLI